MKGLKGIVLLLILLVPFALAYDQGIYELGDSWNVVEDMPNASQASRQGDYKSAYNPSDPIWYYSYISCTETDITKVVPLPQSNVINGNWGWWITATPGNLGDMGFFNQRSYSQLYFKPAGGRDVVIGWRCPQSGYYEVEVTRMTSWSSGFSHSLYLYNDSQIVWEEKGISDANSRKVKKTVYVAKDKFISYRVSGDSIPFVEQQGNMKVTRVLGVSHFFFEKEAFSPKLNQEAIAKFSLFEDADVTLDVLDAKGVCVRNLLTDTPVTRDILQTVTWDGKDNDGIPMADGNWIFRLFAKAVDDKGKEYIAVAEQQISIITQGPQKATVELIWPKPEVLGWGSNQSQLYIKGSALGEGVGLVQAWMNGVEVASAAVDFWGKYELTIPLELGENNFQLLACDSIGNPSEAPATLHKVNYDPNLKVGIPELKNSDIVSAAAGRNMKIRGRILEPGSIQLIVQDLKGIEIVNQSENIGVGPYEIVWDGLVADGKYQYTWVVKTGDITFQWQGNVMVDQTPPDVVSLMYPWEDAVLAKNKVTFAWEKGNPTVLFRLRLADNPELENANSWYCKSNSFLAPQTLDDGQWYWQVVAEDEAGNIQSTPAGSFLVKVMPALPLDLSNISGGPNPFNPYTSGNQERFYLGFTLSQEAQVEGSVYNLAGQKVYRSDPVSFLAGNYYWSWNGRDSKQRVVPAGLYVVIITARAEPFRAPAVAKKVICVLY